jgi:hypothetical protein
MMMMVEIKRYIIGIHQVGIEQTATDKPPQIRKEVKLKGNPLKELLI